MQFAPSTLALAALFISIPLHKLDTRSWFNSVPSFCLMDPANPLFECPTYFQMQKVANIARTEALARGGDERTVQLAIAAATREGRRGLQAKMLDVKACIAAIETQPYMRSVRESLRSPVNRPSAPVNGDRAAEAAADENREQGVKTANGEEQMNSTPTGVADAPY